MGTDPHVLFLSRLAIRRNFVWRVRMPQRVVRLPCLRWLRDGRPAGRPYSGESHLLMECDVAFAYESLHPLYGCVIRFESVLPA